MVSKITSVHNDRVRYVRSLARRRSREQSNRFVVEGTRLVEEVVRAGIKPALVLCTETWQSNTHAQELMAKMAPADEGIWLVADSVLASCADTETPQGIIAVVPVPHIAPRPGLILIVDGLRDPGNLGTILRSAEAAGVGQVLTTPGTVELYNAKVVRAAMGAHFRLPASMLDWPAIGICVAGQAVWLADAAGEAPYDTVDWSQPSALIIGGEASGASPAASRLATGRVKIPMAEGPESLNAAMAATVILFEVARQKRRRAAETLPTSGEPQ